MFEERRLPYKRKPADAPRSWKSPDHVVCALAVILTAVFGLLAYNLFGGEKRIEQSGWSGSTRPKTRSFPGNWACCWGRRWSAATPIAC